MGCGGSKSTPAKAVEQVEVKAEAKTLLDSAPAKAGEEASQAVVKVPLKVTVVSARGLRNADWAVNGKSDPYCICEIADKADSKRQTNTVNDQLNPEWNHECEEITSYCVGDALTFTVKDKDPLKPDDFLGKVVLKSEQFFPNGFEDEVALTEAGDKIEAFMKVKVAVVHPKVRVTVVSAKGLRNADWVGKSDPYCVCEVLGKANTKLQSSCVAESLDPEWNHEGEVVGYHAGDALTFTVKDQDPLKPDDKLGTVSLPYSAFCENGFDGELQLTEVGEGLTSMLKLKVELGEKPVAEAAPQEATTEEAAADETKADADAVQNSATSQQVQDDVIVEEKVSEGKTCFC